MTDTSPTTAQLRGDFDKTAQEQSLATTLLSGRDADRQKLLLSASDSEIIKFDGETKKLELRRDRALARQQAIRAEYPAVAERELQEQKIALRAAAEKARERGKAAHLRAEQAIKEFFEAELLVFEADAEIAASNENLPDGVANLLPVEADFRWAAGEPSRIAHGERHVLPPGFVAQVGQAVTEKDRSHVEPETRVIHGRPAVRPEPLYQVMECPPLRPGDVALRVSGTPLGLGGHRAKRLQPAPGLPEHTASTAAPASDDPAVQHSKFAQLPR